MLSRRPGACRGRHAIAIDAKRPSAFLARFKAPARRDIALTYAFAFVAGLLVIAQAALVARLVNRVLFEKLPLDGAHAEIAALLATILLRFFASWAAERSGYAAAARVMRAMRAELLDHVGRIGPAGLSGLRTGETVAAISSGVRAVEPFYTRYLPASLLAVLLPLAILCAVFPFDWVSGLIFLVTAPVIPFFMILIGKGAEALNQRQWRQLARMSGHLLDAVQGLATLKAFDAAGRMARQVGEVADAYRRDTMAVLRVAFLSSLVLEFFATVSIAMVAIFIGFRLLWGGMDFLDGLFILLLAPEFYQPLRAMGTAYHARMEAIGAAERLVALADAPALAEAGGTVPVPRREAVELTFEGVSLTYPDGRRALEDVTLRVPAGAKVALVGASGAGKSSLLDLACGFVRPTAGRVLVNGVPLGDLDMTDWRGCIAYARQRPRLFSGTLADNVAPGEDAPDPARLMAALAAAGLADAVARVPGGLDGRLGEGGAGLSGGEGHRLALARAFYRDAPFVVLDEPTAHLDRATGLEIEAALARLLKGRTALLAIHRLAQAATADLVVVLDDGRIVESGGHAELLARGGAYARLVAADGGLRQVLEADA